MSGELPRDVRSAFDALDVRYDDEDLTRGVRRLHVRVRERRQHRIILATAFAITVIAGGVLMRRAQQPDASSVVLADGTRCTPRGASSRLTVVREDATAVLMRVEAGAARFAVAKQHGRRFEVEAGDVTVRVVGTVFDVERVEGTARVSVSEGKVEVATDRATWAPVTAGGSWTRDQQPQSPPSAAETAKAEPIGPVRAPGPAVRASHTSGGGHEPAAFADKHVNDTAWRALARAGDYGRAFAALKAKDSEPPQDSADDLFLAADSARLSGHPGEAMSYLIAIVDRHAEDARADLAAFTLGRIYLDDLNRPTDAARVFATARRLAPNGALAEDALAREVEAWNAAGQSEKARARGEFYLEKYPRGQRAEMVRRAMGMP